MLLANYVTGFVPLLQPLCSCCDPSEGRVHSLRHSRGGREEYPFETTPNYVVRSFWFSHLIARLVKLFFDTFCK